MDSKWQDMLKRGASPTDVLKEAERVGVDPDEVFAEAVPWFWAALVHYMQKVRVSTGSYVYPDEIPLSQRSPEYREARIQELLEGLGDE